MNVEPVHQLASAIHTSPKLFACVLGSGISRDAGIPTGWQIVLDLVQRHAEQIREGDACAKDPAAWFKAKYGGDPDYSEVVSKLAPTTDLRRNLLERYFTVLDEVTNERREHEPTPAHRSIAKLVQRGLLRVIVTTNFDRLMERALRDAGVARVEVVSSESDAADSYPFHAAEAFVFKIHGDWRDTWLRNSREELASYSPAIAKLLQRIVDEHGLIVCGWSAEYDVALREAITRRERRFPIHWVDPKPGAATQKLVSELSGQHVAATGDQYFSELELAVAALDRQRPPSPLSGDVLVARAKRFIAANNEMELDDLVQDATRALCAWIEEKLDTSFSQRSPNVTSTQRAEEIASACEAQAAPLARVLATLARYKQPSYLAQRALSALLRTAETRAIPLRASNEGWWWFLSYPALLCAYAHGVPSAEKLSWRAAITAVRDAGSGHATLELRLPPEKQEYFIGPLYGRFSPVSPALRFSTRISEWLFPLTETWIPRRTDFERAFDQFDALLCGMSLRGTGYGWKPRCSVTRDVMEPSSARLSFDEVIEDWLITRLARRVSQGGDEPLWEAFADTELDFMNFADRLRAWKPV